MKLGAKKHQEFEPYPISSPQHKGWRPPQLLKDILELRLRCAILGRFGPYAVVLSTGWEYYLHKKYFEFDAIPSPFLSEDQQDCLKKVSSVSIRERILQLENIVAIAHSNKLANFDIRIAEIVEGAK